MKMAAGKARPRTSCGLDHWFRKESQCSEWVAGHAVPLPASGRSPSTPHALLCDNRCGKLVRAASQNMPRRQRRKVERRTTGHAPSTPAMSSVSRNRTTTTGGWIKKCRRSSVRCLRRTLVTEHGGATASQTVDFGQPQPSFPSPSSSRSTIPCEIAVSRARAKAFAFVSRPDPDIGSRNLTSAVSFGIART